MKERSFHTQLSTAESAVRGERVREPIQREVLSYQVRRSPWDTPFLETVSGSVLIYVTPQKRFGDTGLVGGRALASFTTVKDIIAKAFGAYYSVSTQGKAHLLDLYRSLSQPADDDLVQVRTLGGFTIFAVNQANFNESVSIEKTDGVLLGELLRDRPDLCEVLFYRPYYEQMVTEMYRRGYQINGTVAKTALTEGFDLLGLMSPTAKSGHGPVVCH